MHARVTTIQGRPDQADESQRVIREEILPRAREIPGFAGLLSLEDPESGKSLTVTLWESEEAMRASEQAADALRGQAVSAVEGSELTSVDRYEVTIDERG